MDEPTEQIEPGTMAASPASAPARCPACGSDRLSKVGDFASFDNHARWMGMARSKRGRAKDLTAKAERCRVCLACGFLMLYLSDDGLAEVREAFGGS